MKYKKIFILLLVLSLVITFGLVTRVSASGNIASINEIRNEKSTEGYSKLFESFGFNGLTAVPSYPKTYGGAFINDSGELVIQQLNWDSDASYTVDELKAITGLESFVPMTVEYSFNELVTANNYIGRYIHNECDDSGEKLMIPHNSSFSGQIVESSIDCINNEVLIFVEDISPKNIDIFRSDIYDAPFLRFILASKERPSLETSYKSGKGRLNQGSIGFPAKYNTYSGLVTAYHVSGSGTSSINGQLYGSTYSSSPSRDYAFVRQTNFTDTVTRGIHDSNKTLSGSSYSYLVQGSLVGRSGNRSGYRTGKVIRIGVNNNLGSDLLESNCGSLIGDSGGPYFGNYSSSTPSIAGIHIGGFDSLTRNTFFRGIGYLYNHGYRIY